MTNVIPTNLHGRVANAFVVAGLVLGLVAGLTAKSELLSPKLTFMLILTGWGLAVFGYAFLGAFERISLARLIQDLPTARIRSAPQGYVELRGIARSTGRTVVCPGCGINCLWYSYTADKKRHTPGRGAPDIILDDRTGLAFLWPEGAELFSARRGEYQAVNHTHICVSDPIYVLGEFHTKAPPVDARGAPVSPEELDRRRREEAVRKKLQWLKYDERRVKLFDVNRDGKLDARELEAMAKVAEMQAEVPPAPPEAVIMRPTSDTDRLPFVIVVGTEKDAVKAARESIIRRGVLSVLAGLFLLTFMLFPALPDRRTAKAAPGSAPVRVASTRQLSPTEAAFQMHRDGNLTGAIEQYDKLLSMPTADPELYFWRGSAEAQNREYDKALEDLRHEMERKPNDIRAFRLADWVLFQQKRFAEIIAMWDDYLARNPDDASGWYERAGTKHWSGDEAGSKEDAEHACSLGLLAACQVAGH